MTRPALAQLDRCNKCGFCLPTCPTYVRLELEPASPRGRLAIAEEVAAGRQAVDEYVAEQMYLCLGCRACETACPSGVEFGVVLQDMRHQLDLAGVAAPGHQGLPTLLLEQVITQPPRLRSLGRLFRWYQRSGLQVWVRRTGLLRRAFPALAALEAGLPTEATTTPAAPPNTEQADVAFFRGCIMDVLYRDTNNRSVHVLERLGHSVTCPPGEVCCGALHAHAGRLDEARTLARRNVEAFEATGALAYVNAAGGCGAFLGEYGHLLADDPEWAQRAAEFSRRMRDFSVAVTQSPGWPDLASTPGGGAMRVTYQASCDLRHGQKVSAEPREILGAIGGYVELPGADTCCGSAGLYSLSHRGMSSRVLGDKIAVVADLAPDIIVTTNPGCRMQIQAGVAQAGLGERMTVVHLADLLYAVLEGRMPERNDGA